MTEKMIKAVAIEAIITLDKKLATAQHQLKLASNRLNENQIKTLAGILQEAHDARKEGQVFQTLHTENVPGRIEALAKASLRIKAFDIMLDNMIF